MKYRRKVPKVRKDSEGKALPTKIHKMKPLQEPKHKKQGLDDALREFPQNPEI